MLVTGAISGLITGALIGYFVAESIFKEAPEIDGSGGDGPGDSDPLQD